MAENGAWQKWASPTIARSRLKKWASPTIARSRLEKYELAQLWLYQGLKIMG
jgi:hypothetical protein